MFSLGRLDIFVIFGLQADVYKFVVIFVFIVFNVEFKPLMIHKRVAHGAYTKT